MTQLKKYNLTCIYVILSDYKTVYLIRSCGEHPFKRTGAKLESGNTYRA
jgi:hypothetical protein